MTTSLIVALLLQSFPLVPRLAVENPAAVSEVPKKQQKDYNQLWTRFVTGKDDTRVIKDADKLLKKTPNFVQAIIIKAYVDLYNRRLQEAEKKFEQALSYQPGNRIALSYLGELAFVRQDYARASDLYALLLDADPSRTDVEPKRQKALLQATENIIQNAARAERENRLTEAETHYLHALRIAPGEPSLHGRLGELYLKQKAWEQALAAFQKEREFGGADDETDRAIAEALTNLGRTEEARTILERLNSSGGEQALEGKVAELEDLGRWGQDLAKFHQIQSAPEIRREQLAALIVRYFPQLMEFRQTSMVVTDIQESWARPEIQVVTGVGVVDPFPNHTFRPAAPVSRGEFAMALARLARLLSISMPNAPPVPTTDVDSNNALYREVQVVVTHGLMTLDETGSFNISSQVSGENGVRSLERLLNLSRGRRK
jgi:tetratricopeptide (TPR) repeat protein